MSSLSLLAIVLTVTLTLAACSHPIPVVVLVPAGPVTHEIGHWAEDDLVCIELPAREALYVPRRCVPMGTIRALILQTQRAGADDRHPPQVSGGLRHRW